MNASQNQSFLISAGLANWWPTKVRPQFPVHNPQQIAATNRGLAHGSMLGFVLFILSFASTFAANLVVNGSFENNSAATTVFNPNNADFNSLVPNVTAFGIRPGIDLQTIGSGFGQLPQDGSWKVSLCSDLGGEAEAFSLNLIGPLTLGQSYQLDFYIERLQSGNFNGGSVEVGLSSNATVFGTQIASANASIFGWLFSSTTFVAPNAGNFISVRVTTVKDSWVGLDNFVLNPIAVPEPGACTIFGFLSCFGFVARWKTRR